jgi:hypothetical protein
VFAILPQDLNVTPLWIREKHVFDFIHRALYRFRWVMPIISIQVCGVAELPAKGQEMSPDVFLEGQFFWVTVEDATLDSAKVTKSDAEVYSRITEFHSVERAQS